MNGRKFAILVERLMVSSKLLAMWLLGIVSPKGGVRALVTFKVTSVLLMAVTCHPMVPLMSTPDGETSDIGQAMRLGDADPAEVSQVWRNETETVKL